MSVVDASVAFKWLVHEQDSDKARNLKTAGATIAPELVLTEVANALWKQSRAGFLTARASELLLHQLPALFDELVPAVGIIDAAGDIARRLDHPVYDCLYLALAEARDDMLVTADARLLGKVARTPWRKRVADLAKL